jgi:hypothetical protein
MSATPHAQAETPDRIAEIRQREQQATAGRWSVQNIPSCGLEVHWRLPRHGELNAPVCHMRWTDGMNESTEARVLADASFIAHARQDVPYLLDLVASLQARLQQAEADMELAIDAVKALNDARLQAEAERDNLRHYAAEVWDALADDVARNGERDVPDGASVAEGVKKMLADLHDAEQQIRVLSPGGTYAWKSRAEKAETDLATLRAEQSGLMQLRDDAQTENALLNAEVTRLLTALTKFSQ